MKVDTTDREQLSVVEAPDIENGDCPLDNKLYERELSDA
jgi:hypothetical protein